MTFNLKLQKPKRKFSFMTFPKKDKSWLELTQLDMKITGLTPPTICLNKMPPNWLRECTLPLFWYSSIQVELKCWIFILVCQLRGCFKMNARKISMLFLLRLSWIHRMRSKELSISDFKNKKSSSSKLSMIGRWIFYKIIFWNTSRVKL